MNNYKSNEQYLLDLNRFYFELTQINYNKMSKVKKKEYNRLEKFMLKLLYQEENIKAAQWTPIFEIIQVERGLRYLLNYNYISMKNKIEILDCTCKQHLQPFPSPGLRFMAIWYLNSTSIGSASASACHGICLLRDDFDNIYYNQY